MNIFDNGKNITNEEIFDVLHKSDNCKIERIISFGHNSPERFWYEQNEDEWVLLLSGHAELELFNGEIVYLKEGDYYFIPAMLKHRVKSTAKNEATIWLAVFINNNLLKI